MIDSILVLAVIVLPGWLSITVNQLYYPRSIGIDKSTVMEWGMVFYHAVVVHVLMFMIAATVLWFWPGLWTSGLEQMVAEGPIAFTRIHPIEGFWILGPYSLVLIVVSVLSGVIHLPSRTIAIVSWIPETLKLAPNRLQEDPVWYSALTIDRRVASKQDVLLRVRMKVGDIYVGNLDSYPILPDSSDTKDLKLGKAILYPGGDLTAPVELDFSESGGGGVLLNTSNVSSIEYLFHDNYETSDQN